MESIELANAGERKAALFYFINGFLWFLAFLVFIMLPDGGAKPLLFAWLKALWAVNGVLWVGLGFLAVRSGVRLDEEGPTARSRIWTRRLRWQEVERFALGRSMTVRLSAIRPNGRLVQLQDQLPTPLGPR